MKQIMIRADDLGYSQGINYGIERAVKHGIINNVGWMVNMDASMHGYELLKDCDISWGLHTNICAGKPITDPKYIPSLVEKDGSFHPSKVYRQADHDIVNLEEALIEIEAQLQRFIEWRGKAPDYFEAHAVKSKTFDQAIQMTAQKHGYLYQELSFDSHIPVQINGHTMYMTLKGSVPGYDPVYEFKHMVENGHEDCINLLIYHPGYIDAYLMEHSSLVHCRPLETEASVVLKDYVQKNKVHLLSYKELAQ